VGKGALLRAVPTRRFRNIATSRVGTARAIELAARAQPVRARLCPPYGDAPLL